MRTGGRLTIVDVARAAGVHPSTVSRVLNARADLALRPATRGRVLAAAAELGYRPSQVARSLRLQRTQTLGMLVPDITNPFFPGIIRGAEDAAHARGYALVLCNTDDVPEREATYLRVLRERQVDGLLIASTRMADATIASLRADGFPFVLVNRLASPSDGDLAVTVDNRAASAEMVAHLASLGHRRIAHIAGPRETTTGAERAAGYRDGLRRAHLAFDARLVTEAETYSEAAGLHAGRALLALPEPPTAIYGANDLIAFGALRAIREAGLSVPEDVSLAGFNDVPQAAFVEPGLTTVRVPQDEMGKAAAELLLARLAGEPIASPRVVLPAALIVRGSTSRVRTEAVA